MYLFVAKRLIHLMDEVGTLPRRHPGSSLAPWFTFSLDKYASCAEYSFCALAFRATINV